MSDTPISLQGTLSLATWIQIAELEQFTGTLSIGDDVVSFRDGMVVGATSGSDTGFEGLFAIFLDDLRAGSLAEGEPAQETVRMDATGAILSGMRMVDEWARVRAEVLTPVQDEPPPGLEALWPHFDGERTAIEVIQASGKSVGSSIDALSQALGDRLLKRAAPPDTARADLASTPVSDDDFWPLMDEAHDHTRKRDYASARRCLMMALRARPDDSLATQNLRRLERLVARQRETS